jgi:ribokinase
MQREIPDEVNIQAARIARESNTLTILDVGGMDSNINPELLQYVDLISPNETELLRITGKSE